MKNKNKWTYKFNQLMRRDNKGINSVWRQARQSLNSLYHWLRKSRLEPIKRFATTLKNYFTESTLTKYYLKRYKLHNLGC